MQQNLRRSTATLLSYSCHAAAGDYLGVFEESSQKVHANPDEVSLALSLVTSKRKDGTKRQVQANNNNTILRLPTIIHTLFSPA